MGSRPSNIQLSLLSIAQSVSSGGAWSSTKRFYRAGNHRRIIELITVCLKDWVKLVEERSAALRSYPKIVPFAA